MTYGVRPVTCITLIQSVLSRRWRKLGFFSAFILFAVMYSLIIRKDFSLRPFIGKLQKEMLIKRHVHYIVIEPTSMQFYSKMDLRQKLEMWIILRYMDVSIIEHTTKHYSIIFIIKTQNLKNWYIFICRVRLKADV